MILKLSGADTTWASIKWRHLSHGEGDLSVWVNKASVISLDSIVMLGGNSCCFVYLAKMFVSITRSMLLLL